MSSFQLVNIDEKLSSETTYGHSNSLDRSELSEVIGLDKEEEALVAEMLCSDELGCCLRVIPIINIAGSGKTTLASTIYNRKNIKKHLSGLGFVCQYCVML